MHWILIMWMTGSGYAGNPDISVDHMHFETQAACKAAFAQVKEVNAGTHGLAGVCVEDK